MKNYIVYKTTNLINNKIYIGCHITENLEDEYLGSGIQISKAIKKYGRDNFKREILFLFSSKEEMLLKESEIVDSDFIKRKDTYNLTIGGYGGFYYINEKGLNHSVNQHKIVHEKLKNDSDYREIFCKKVSEGIKRHIDKNGALWKGKKHREETKKRIGIKASKHQSGEGNSQYGTMWITNGRENRKIRKNEEIPENWRKDRVVKHI
mgnify:CR=1 FL=1